MPFDIIFICDFGLSFVAVSIILEWFQLFLTEKCGFKFMWQQHGSLSCIVFFACFFISFLVLKQQKSFIVWFCIFLASVCYLFLKQKQGYSAAEINKCEDETRSIGAYWAHHALEAYYKISLPPISEQITSFEKEHDAVFSIKKLIIIIPLSCYVEHSLDEKDEYIKYIGELSAIECDQGANVNRKYIHPVYRIKEDIFISCEYPNSLSTLWKSKCDMNSETWNYHRNCFIKTLKHLLKDYPCIIAEYDDTLNKPEPLSSFLLSILREERKHVSIFIE